MTLELVILFPIVILIIFTVIQAGLYYHARSVALAAAQEGARAARAETGSADAGGAAAHRFIKDAGGTDVMTTYSVRPSRSATQASVTVTGRPLSVLPGIMNFEVTQTAEGPVARFTEGAP